MVEQDYFTPGPDETTCLMCISNETQRFPNQTTMNLMQLKSSTLDSIKPLEFT